MKNNSLIKFVAYARTKQTVIAAESLKAQYKKLKAYADDNNGELIQSFADVADIHNSTPQFVEAVELCKANDYVLLILTLDSLDTTGRTISELFIKGVRVLCVAAPDLNTRQLALTHGIKPKAL